MQSPKYEISAEFALHDAMDRILGYLSARDLCRAAQVCRTWNEAVQLEFAKRGPERIRLPDTYDVRLTNLAKPKFHLASVMRTKPELAIAFIGPRLHKRSNLNLEKEFLLAYKPQLPYRLMIFGVDTSMMDEEELRCAPSNLPPFLPANGVQGFFLPKFFRQCRTKVGWIVSHEYAVDKKASAIVDSIVPDDPDAKSTILLFGRSFYSIHKRVLSTIRRRFKPNSYTVWGGTTRDHLKIIECRTDEYPGYMGMNGCIAINISGPSIERHSVLVNTDKEMSEIESELVDFEKGLKLKRHSQGLVCGPQRRSGYVTEFTEPYDYKLLMRMIKRIFPDVPFCGFFNDTDMHYFGMNSGKDDADQEFIHAMGLSILIFTHN